ncbi:pyocin activator PrtN family protein [Microbaculum sp. FT89]|uniref:pyocin activator PrtN family protein n=1 Tax=Microbaculum sp. FT89 TaxID=3447298 RepID=UPI003F53217E
MVPFAPIELPRFEVDHRTGDRRRATKLNTLFLLMAQYEGRVIVPAEIVYRDYFSHLTIAKFLRKVSTGEIDLPLTRAERSQKSARGVHLRDLTLYLDKRREIALSEARAFRTK